MFYMWRGRKERMYLHMNEVERKAFFTYKGVERKECFYTWRGRKERILLHMKR
jgi:hypothetical protein